jgi:uncharacterized membrane protein
MLWFILLLRSRQTICTIETILKDAEAIPAYLPSIGILKDSLRKGKEWSAKVETIQVIFFVLKLIMVCFVRLKFGEIIGYICSLFSFSVLFLQTVVQLKIFGKCSGLDSLLCCISFETV